MEAPRFGASQRSVGDRPVALSARSITTQICLNLIFQSFIYLAKICDLSISRAMNVRTLCLAVLMKAPRSGYEIRKLVAEGTLAHFAEASYGAIYPALDKLEQEGLVTSHEERDPGKPTRRIFAITDQGRGAFVAALHEMPAHDEFRSPFLLVASCAMLVEREHLKRVIDAHLDWHRVELKRLQTEREQCSGAAYVGFEWTLDLGITMVSTEIRYLEQNRARLEAIAGTALVDCRFAKAGTVAQAGE